MINEVTITAKFVTGTTERNSEQAEARCKELLLEKLKEVHICPTIEGSGLFSVEILTTKSEEI